MANEWRKKNTLVAYRSDFWYFLCFFSKFVFVFVSIPSNGKSFTIFVRLQNERKKVEKKTINVLQSIFQLFKVQMKHSTT